MNDAASRKGIEKIKYETTTKEEGKKRNNHKKWA